MIKSERMSVVVLLFVLVSFAGAVDKPTTAQKSCVTKECHISFGKKAVVHGPVGLGDCKSCHKPVDPAKHTFEPSRKGRDLCEFCHLEQADKKNVHGPLKDGNCMKCHDPHSSDHKALLPSATIADLCYKCHETGKKAAFPHGPVAVGECSICHDSHSSDHKKLLTMDPKELCFSCHVITKEELTEFEHVHEPAKGNCFGCHDPHGADNRVLLKAQAPELCYPCHEDIKKLAEESKHKHNVVGEPGGCLKCHTPHASTVPSGLKQVAMDLCLSCHDKPVGLDKENVMKPFTDEVAGKKFMHGPVGQKDCEGCHTTHGSDHFRLLKKEYPPQFYSPFKKSNYDLCFSCHEETLVQTAETASLTDFRNGSSNLHYLHVNKDRRGRTCRSCHATHASNLPKHIRKSVPYGVWDLPIQFAKTETGGSCKPGCHVPYAYDRNQAVEYKKP